MSQENVEIVRRAFVEFQTNGWEVMFDTFWAPEIVWDMASTGIPGLGTYHGHAALRSFFEDDWFAAFPLEEWEQELIELIDCGERVVAVAHQHGHGSASGASVELEYAQVCTLRDGKMVRVDTYLDRTKALEAAGLSE
jgi:ketosteroid isomerase-like protein